MSLRRRLRARIRFSWGVAFGELAVVVAAAGAVAVTDLGDRRGVQRVVESAVAAPRQPMCGAPAGGELDRGGAGVGRRRLAVVNRVGSPEKPMSMAATIGPIPKISVNVVADAATVALIRRLESPMTTSRWCDLIDELDSLAVPLNGRRIGRRDLRQQRSCLRDNHFGADAAGQQLGDEGVQTTALLGPPAGHIGVPLGQQPTHHDMVGASHHRQRRGVQRSERHRAGIVRIGLHRLTRAEHAHP